MNDLSTKRRWLPPLVAALIAAVLQTAALGYMVESRASILRNGKEVLLKTVPVDPRDLLRGDYVILSYDISSLPPELFKGGLPKAPQEVTVFVRLAKQPDGFWSASEASFTELAPTDDSVVLQSQPFTYYPSSSEIPSPINVAYGIERFYVPEGEGRVLEQARNAEALSVNVRVNDAGRAQIRQIAVEGTPVYEEPLY
ncbi:GDYXXLXY domain-containing protein [Ensifer sp. HO-A22]|uniref:GDYXXLXY domain-containing protein n=1 Tax=Ensifer oleiphilus TaxID=2742698 RepID=A0A7Y6Q925_9HYPH|nr:GDYXXLXY domain-containing protein [Ensifer oleiphilus]NVD41271.1 GDYXXLXY domain-containing protein [Ensifer oleiphilus]